MPTPNAGMRSVSTNNTRKLKRVAVIGQGYVGLPLAVAAVHAGHVVIGYETDERRTESLRDGDSYVEDISNEVLRECLASTRYVPTTNPDLLNDFDVAIIAVPTPLS